MIRYAFGLGGKARSRPRRSSTWRSASAAGNSSGSSRPGARRSPRCCRCPPSRARRARPCSSASSARPRGPSRASALASQLKQHKGAVDGGVQPNQAACDGRPPTARSTPTPLSGVRPGAAAAAIAGCLAIGERAATYCHRPGRGPDRRARRGSSSSSRPSRPAAVGGAEARGPSKPPDPPSSCHATAPPPPRPTRARPARASAPVGAQPQPTPDPAGPAGAATQSRPRHRPRSRSSTPRPRPLPSRRRDSLRPAHRSPRRRRTPAWASSSEAHETGGSPTDAVLPPRVLCSPWPPPAALAVLGPAAGARGRHQLTGLSARLRPTAASSASPPSQDRGLITAQGLRRDRCLCARGRRCARRATRSGDHGASRCPYGGVAGRFQAPPRHRYQARLWGGTAAAQELRLGSPSCA